MAGSTYGQQAGQSTTGGVKSDFFPPIETSSYGAVMPVIYGTNRIPGKIIFLPSDMWAKLAAGSSSGKGGADSSNSVYTQGCGIAICEGMANAAGFSQVALARLWSDKLVYAAYNTPIEVGDSNQSFSAFSFFPGNRIASLAPWSGYLSAFVQNAVGIEFTVPGGGGPYTYLLTDPLYLLPQPAQGILNGLSVSSPYGLLSVSGFNAGNFLQLGMGFQGYISGTVLTITSISSISGIAAVGAALYGPGVTTGTTITARGTGTGGTGTYTVNNSQTIGSSSAPVSFTTADYIVTGAVGNIVYTFISAYGGTVVGLIYKFQTNPGAFQIPYGGTAYVACGNLALGNSNSMKNYSFEVVSSLLGNDSFGCAPVSGILSDMLTNTLHGMAFPFGVDVTHGQDNSSSVLAGLDTYCVQAGISLSPVFDTQKTALNWVEWILEASNCTCVWTQGILRFFPRGDMPMGSFAPFVSAVYSLVSDYNMLANQDEDAIEMERAKSAEIVNCCPIEFSDSLIADQNSQYSTALSQDFEEPNIQASGGVVRPAGALSLKCITRQSVAQLIARTRAQRSVYIRNKYTFRLPQQFSLLDPFDLLALTDTVSGLSNFLVRILSIEETEDDELELVCEEAGLGSSTAVVYQSGAAQGGGQATNLNPISVSTPIIWTPPLAASSGKTGDQSGLPTVPHNSVTPQPVVHPTSPVPGATTQPELWIGAAPTGIANWGGAQVWLSFDGGTTYQYASELGAATVGNLTASFAAGSPLDTTNTLSLDMTPSGAALNSVSAADRDAFTSMLYVDGELISYQTATLTGTNAYNLTSMRRGLYGTAVKTHAVGAPAMRIDANVLRVPLDKSRYGATVMVKIASYNQSRTIIQPLSQVQAFSYGIPNTGAAGANVNPVQETLPLRITFDNYDASQWDFPLSTGNLSVVYVGSVLANNIGGRALQCDTGPVMMVQKLLLPYDPARVYEISAFVRQSAGSTARKLYVGFVGVDGSGVTQVDINGFSTNPSVPSDQNFVTWLDSSLTGAWTLIKGYFTANTTPPAAGVLGATATTPGSPMNLTQYLRLFIAFNCDPNGSATQQINYLRITELASAGALAQNYVNVTCTLQSYHVSTAGDSYLPPSACTIIPGTETVYVSGVAQPRANYSINTTVNPPFTTIVFASGHIPGAAPVTITCGSST